MIKNVILDLDGTLIETPDALKSIVLDAAARFVQGKEPEVFLDALRRVCSAKLDALRDEDYMRFGIGTFDLLFHRKLEKHIQGAAELKKALVGDALRSIGCEADDQSVRRIVAHIEKNWTSHFRLIEGTEAALEALKRRVRLFMLTDGFYEVQIDRVIALDLGKWFDRVYVSEELGEGKRSPEAFVRLMEREGLIPSETVMVGDNFSHDYGSSEKAGILSFYFDRYGKKAGEEVRRVESLAGLVRIIDEENSR